MVGNQQIIPQEKNIFIVSTLLSDDQQGATYARIYEYLKLLKLDKDVRIYLLSTREPFALSETKKELFENVYYCGSSNRGNMATKETKGKLFKKYNKRINHKNFTENVVKFILDFEGQKAVFIYPTINNFKDELYLVKALKNAGLKVFSERNEINIGRILNLTFPKNLVKRGLYGLYYPLMLWDYYLQDKIVKHYDGNIVISSAMEEKVKKLNKNLIRIPILADINRFHDIAVFRNDKELIKIGYTGSITFKRDAIGELVRAINLLVHHHKINNIQLNLYGSGPQDTMTQVALLVEKLGLTKHVVLHGNIPFKDIPKALKEQDILILARPLNIQTKYGLSTKFAEYMASGVPVVATDVSDNSLFIKDNVNGFILEDNRAETTAARLNEIISQKKYLDSTIGRNAYETAKEYFSGSRYTEQFVQFLF